MQLGQFQVAQVRPQLRWCGLGVPLEKFQVAQLGLKLRWCGLGVPLECLSELAVTRGKPPRSLPLGCGCGADALLLTDLY